MTEEDFLERISQDPAINRDVDTIRLRVASIRGSGIRIVHRKLPWFWLNSQTSFTLPASGGVIDMRLKFGDYNKVKVLWVTSGKLEYYSEEKYRRVYPNGFGSSGTPQLYVPLNDREILYAPSPTSDTTINISYYMNLGGVSLQEIPELFHDVLIDYVLANMVNDKEEKILRYQEFYRGLSDIISQAKPSEEEETEIKLDELKLTQGNVNEDQWSR